MWAGIGAVGWAAVRTSSSPSTFHNRKPFHQKLGMIRVPCINHRSLIVFDLNWELLLGPGASAGSELHWTPLRYKSHVTEKVLSWDMWKFYDLSWEMFPLEQGMGISAQAQLKLLILAPDLGSEARTQLHPQRKQRHCPAHPMAPNSPPTALPEISKRRGSEQHLSIPRGNFCLPESKIPTWPTLRGAEQNSALTSWAGFERRFKPAGAALNPTFGAQIPSSVLPSGTAAPEPRGCCWGCCVLRTGLSQAFNVTIAATCSQKWICEQYKRNPALPISFCWQWMLSGGEEPSQTGNSCSELHTPVQEVLEPSPSHGARLALTLSPWIYMLGQKTGLKIATGSETRGRQQNSVFIFTQPSCNSISGQFYPLFNSI